MVERSVQDLDLVPLLEELVEEEGRVGWSDFFAGNLLIDDGVDEVRVGQLHGID